MTKPANEQDNNDINDRADDDDLSREASEDSYDGVPKTEDIRLPKIEEPSELAN